MRIAVIAHALRTGGGGSVGRNLIRALDRAASENNYLFVVPTGAGYEDLKLMSSEHRFVYFEGNAGYLGRWVFDGFKLSKLIRNFQPDVVLGLGNRGLSAPPCAQAILCQDAHLFYPSKHFGKTTWLDHAINFYRKWILRLDLRRSALLFCQTPVAENRLRATYAYKGRTALLPNAISVDSLAGNSSPGTPQSLENAHNALKLFCLTRYYSHKNLESIVDMFKRFREELRNVVVILTISADDHPNAKKLLYCIADLKLTSNIINVGPLKQQELSRYYQHCDALFLPTLLESFSGAYLEAMQFGRPILTSDLDFSRNICKNAAMYFNPWNVCHMKDVILEFMNTPECANRMIEQGRQMIRHTYENWDDLALHVNKEMLDIAATAKQRS